MQMKEGGKEEPTIASESAPTVPLLIPPTEEVPIEVSLSFWCARVLSLISIPLEAAIGIDFVFSSTSVVEISTTDSTKDFSTLLRMFESAITVRGPVGISFAQYEYEILEGGFS